LDKFRAYQTQARRVPWSASGHSPSQAKFASFHAT
jgi:hypothetical protein